MNWAEHAREQGWNVGTQLFGDATKYEGWVEIEITAIGEETVLAKSTARESARSIGRESSWGFDSRAWSVLGNRAGDSA